MIYIVMAEGFEEIEALTPYNLMRRAKLPVKLVSLTEATPKGATLSLPVKCDITIDEALASPDKIDLLMFPGGLGGTLNANEHPSTSALIEKALGDGAYLAAICAAPMILGVRGLLFGKRAIAYPDFIKYLEGADTEHGELVCRDGKIITAAGMGVAFQFGIELIRALCGDEFAKELKEKVRGA